MPETYGLTVPFKSGVDYIITSKFGTRTDPVYGGSAFHSGIDLSAPSGTEIVASANGVVKETGYNANELGNYVYIEHVINGVTYYTAYGHMLDDSIVVKEGEPVTSKQKIGIIGSTGKSTGIHLHFSVMTPNLSFDKENLKDPLSIVKKDLDSKAKK